MTPVLRSGNPRNQFQYLFVERTMIRWAPAVALIACITFGAARTATAQTDSTAVAGVVDRYHRALAQGDSAAALALLAPDAVILEAGGIETREEYRSHHLPGDMAFAAAVRSERGAPRIVIRGDVAWVSSARTTQGTFRDRPVDAAGAELMVLTREPGGWTIRAIHWSSRSRRPPR